MKKAQSADFPLLNGNNGLGNDLDSHCREPNRCVSTGDLLTVSGFPVLHTVSNQLLSLSGPTLPSADVHQYDDTIVATSSFIQKLDQQRRQPEPTQSLSRQTVTHRSPHDSVTETDWNIGADDGDDTETNVNDASLQVFSQQEQRRPRTILPLSSLPQTGNIQSPRDSHADDSDSVFRIALVISHCPHPVTFIDRAVKAITHPISQCRVVTLVILRPLVTSNPNNGNQSPVTESGEVLTLNHQIAYQWLGHHRIPVPTDVTILFGMTGFRRALDPALSPKVDAVYLNTLDATTAVSLSEPSTNECVVSLECDLEQRKAHRSSVVQVLQRRCSIEVLEAGLHLLLRDPFSTSLDEFRRQLQIAKSHNRFVQFYSLFNQEHRVQKFMDAVLSSDQFRQNVTRIDATLSVLYDDLPKLGIPMMTPPLQKDQGCLRRLGRHCVLVGLIVMTKLGSRPVSARVISYEIEDKGSATPLSSTRQRSLLHRRSSLDSDFVADDSEGSEFDDFNDVKHINTGNRYGPELDSLPATTTNRGEAIAAECVVTFTNHRVLTFHVSYSASAITRQVLEVRAREKYATMTDFAIPHRDGLSTYRVYEKVEDPLTGRLTIDGGAACDVPSGPSHDVMMWRRFRHLAQSVEQNNGWYQNYHPPSSDTNGSVVNSQTNDDVKELTRISLYTKYILNALVESANQNYSEVPIESLEMDDC